MELYLSLSPVHIHTEIRIEREIKRDQEEREIKRDRVRDGVRE